MDGVQISRVSTSGCWEGSIMTTLRRFAISYHALRGWSSRCRTLPRHPRWRRSLQWRRSCPSAADGATPSATRIRLPGGGIQIHDDPHELRQGGHAHLLHHTRAMNLDGALAEAEVRRHDLVRLAAGYQREHLAFARGE